MPRCGHSALFETGEADIARHCCTLLDPAMLLEIFIVLALIVLNGLLAMSELAIVSARPVRLRVRAEQGEKGAQTALDLAEEPGRFLSTVQIGITLVGVLSGAISGATLGGRLAAVLPSLGISQSMAHPLGVGIVVVCITYLSLIVGELVPKQIALRAPEAVAVRVAPAMRILSRIAAPLVWLLDRSGRLALALLGQSGGRESSVSDEEIRMVIAEAEGAGVIEKGETEMIQGVMRIADRNARGLMTPRHEVTIAEARDTLEELIARFRDSGHSRLPLRNGGPDDLVGIVHSRDLLNVSGKAFDAAALVQPAPAIHEALPAMQVVEMLRSAPGHMVLVFDEYGHFEGIITPMDILGAIAGGFDADEHDDPKVVERKDGSLLVAGWMPVDEFAARIGVGIDEDRDYDTVAGLVLEIAGELPATGKTVSLKGWRIEVVDMDGRRIDKLLVCREPEDG
jgi:putative hemolysin